MKAAVIYKSHYGSTQSYAKWIAEDLSADLLRADKIKPINLQKYDTIIYGGGIYAGGVNGVGLLGKSFEIIKDKRLFIFTVCASDPTKEENIKAIRSGLEHKLPTKMYETAGIYHLRGGLFFSKMKFFHKTLMNMMIKMLGKKPENELSDEEKGMLEMLKSTDQDTDFTDRTTIAPLVSEIRAGEK